MLSQSIINSIFDYAEQLKVKADKGESIEQVAGEETDNSYMISKGENYYNIASAPLYSGDVFNWLRDSKNNEVKVVDDEKNKIIAVLQKIKNFNNLNDLKSDILPRYLDEKYQNIVEQWTMESKYKININKVDFNAITIK